MEIKNQIDLLAELSGMEIADDEREKLVADIDNILSYVEQLQELEIETKPFARIVIEGDDHRKDVIVSASEAERKSVINSFPSKTEDDLLEAHAVLDHKV